ncbi:MAG TPA: acylphosphatase [Thermoanaerobaculia bacterium]|nr:acylphosphatase [Thermoanaerobaculia bacterium]
MNGADRGGGWRRWVVRGRVQGVGFRFFVKRLADSLALVGWVRNVHDGSVEVVAGGAEEVLRQFEQGLREGPPAARVERVETSLLSAPSDAIGFEILR